MAAGNSAVINESNLDDFVLAVRRKTSKDRQDIITPEHPTFKRLQSRGAIKDENPGQGPVQDVRYLTARRTVHMSRSQTAVARNKSESRGLTQAQYDWILSLTTLYIPEFTKLNTVTPEALFNYVKEQLDAQETEVQNLFVEILWDGLSVGTNHQFGLKEGIQFVPTADPSAGAVGGLSVDTYDTWANQAANYNAAFRTVSSGYRTANFIMTGTESLLQLYMDCSNNSDARTKAGQPDLIAANDVYYRYCAELVQDNIIFNDEGMNAELGVDGFRFRNASIYHDRDVPDDPNNSAYGVAFVMNTGSFEWNWAKGIKNVMGGMYPQTEGPAGYCWDRKDQHSTKWKDRRKNGVHFGVQ